MNRVRHLPPDEMDTPPPAYPFSAPRSACKPGSVPRGDAIHRVRRFIAPAGVAVIYLGRRLPAASSGLPGARTGRAAPCPPRRASPLLGLAPGGGCLAARVTPSAGGLLHHLFTLARSTGDLPAAGARWRSVSVALSAGYPAWVLPSTVPCGARTFLTLRPTSGRPEASGVTGRDRPAGLGAISIITHHRALSRGLLRCLSVRFGASLRHTSSTAETQRAQGLKEKMLDSAPPTSPR